MISHKFHRWIACCAVALGMYLFTAPAHADLTVCNQNQDRVAVAVGYHDEHDWVAEGWWNIDGATCETVIEGNLTGRFYYVHAINYDSGGSWGGTSFMCTAVRKFTIRGRSSCAQRGYRRTGFYEIDTGDAQDWVQQLGQPTKTVE